MRDIFATLHVACGTLTKYFMQIISNVNTLYDASIYYMVRGPRSYRRHQVNRSTGQQVNKSQNFHGVQVDLNCLSENENNHSSLQRQYKYTFVDEGNAPF